MSTRLAFLTSLLLAAAPPLAAQRELSLGAALGTTGPAISVAVRGTRFGLRAGTSFASWSYKQKLSGSSFEAELAFKDRQVVADFFPWSGSFHLSGGVAGPPVRLQGTGRETLNHYYIINGVSWPASQVGDLLVDIKWPNLSPYLGLGWSGGLGGERTKITADIGATIGTPKVTLAATKAASGSALESDVNAQRDRIQHDVNKWAKVYPVVALGIVIRL